MMRLNNNFINKVFRSFWLPCRLYSVSANEAPKPFDAMPGLKSLPVIGPLHHFLPGGMIGPKPSFTNLNKALHEKFGPIVKMDGIFFSRPIMVFLYNPDDFDQVFRAEETAALRPGFDTAIYYREVLRKSRFNGVFGLTAAQGEKWREFRTKVNPALLKPKLVKLYAPGLEEIADEMVTRLVSLNTDYLKNNFMEELSKWSLESVALVGLGSRLGCLRDDDVGEDHPGRLLAKCAKDILDLSFKLEFLPSLWKLVATPNFNKLMKSYDLQWDLSAMYIDKAKKNIEDRGHDIPEEDKSIIEKLLAIDETVAILMANEMLLAGIDTVAQATTGVLYNLGRNLEVQDKLRQEIRSGESRKFLKACIKESLRLNPILVGNLRRTSKEHIVGGYTIPKGVDVVSGNEYLSKFEKYFPRPLEYLPERWLVDKNDPLYYGNAHPMITAPFGFGIRMCIGRRIAELEIESLVTKLLRNHQVVWDGPPIKVVNKILNSFVKPYHFKFQLAK